MSKSGFDVYMERFGCAGHEHWRYAVHHGLTMMSVSAFIRGGKVIVQYPSSSRLEEDIFFIEKAKDADVKMRCFARILAEDLARGRDVVVIDLTKRDARRVGSCFGMHFY